MTGRGVLFYTEEAMSSYLSIDFKRQSWPKAWLSSVVVAMAVLTLWVISLLVFGFSLPLYAVAMLIIALAVFVRPVAGLPVVILGTMWFERWFTLQPIVLGDQTYKLYPLDLVMFATAAGFLFHQAFGHEKRKLHLRTIDAWLMVFIVLCMAFLLFSVTNASADAALAFSAFKNYAFYALLFWLVAITVQTHEDLRLIMKTCLAGGLGILVFVAIGLARGEGLWTEYTPLSTEGVRLLAFPHAFYLSLALVMSLVLLLYRLRPEKASLFIMWAQLAGVIGSLMRHIWISLAMVAAVIWAMVPAMRKKHLIRFFAKNAAVVTVLLVMLTFVVTIFPLSDLSLRIRDVSDPLYMRARSLVNSAADSSARWRIFAWRAAQESFVQQPLFGIGYGQELSIDFETYRRVVPIRELHNSLLVLIVQMGLVGTIAFGGLLYQAFAAQWRAWRGKGLLWPYQLAFFSAWLLFLFASLWQPYFETNLTGIFFWILLGLMAVSCVLDETQPSTRS